jgi:DNA polymerase
MSDWTDHVERWKNCTDCPLYEQRDRIVLARGTVPCDVVFVGEAPGASEDAIGLPFVGPAGKLLDQIIDRSVPSHVRYALTNLVACFPREAKMAGDNEPSVEEITACKSRLREFLHAVATPSLIVCVGRLASDWVDRMTDCQYADIAHPASILRMPLAQRQMATQKCIVQVKCAVEEMLRWKATAR